MSPCRHAGHRSYCF